MVERWVEPESVCLAWSNSVRSSFWSTGLVLIPNLRYLLVHNILAARAFLSEFLSLLIIAKPSVVPEAPPRSFTLGDSDEIVVTTDTGLNFLQLLIRVCQRASPGSGGVTGARNAWDRFMRRYQNKGGIFGTEQFKQVSPKHPFTRDVMELKPTLGNEQHSATRFRFPTSSWTRSQSIR
jgi:hypothetical protein